MPHPWDSEWKDLGKLQTGGQGVTRLVESLKSPEHQGVLKYLKNNKSPAARARMRREVASLRALHTLGGKVPEVYSDNTSSSDDDAIELFIVMELIEGPTLEDHVKTNPLLTVNQAIDFSLDLCDTVKIAHAESILHRDIKPDNIIVRNVEDHDLCIVDYGLSFNANDDALTETVETFRNKFLDLPETNTPGGNRRDPRSDVTALCAVFYFMLTGHHPGHLQDASGRLPHLRPGFSVRDVIAGDARHAQVELLLSQGLAPQLQARFQSIDELATRLVSLKEQDAGAANYDPVTTALQLSRQLRAADRTTQLKEFQPVADQVMHEFVHRTRDVAQELGRFSLKFGAGGNNGPKLHDGTDGVTGPFTATVKANHHNDISRIRVYKVGSRGEQCVVLGANIATDGQSGRHETCPWEEVVWYEGKADDVHDALDFDLKRWLDTALQEIAAEILGSTS